MNSTNMKTENLSINDFFINRLACLNKMYAQIEVEAREQNLIKQWHDWQEWHALDLDAKQYILDYLKQTD
jgi:hypothetical protein